MLSCSLSLSLQYNFGERALLPNFYDNSLSALLAWEIIPQISNYKGR